MKKIEFGFNSDDRLNPSWTGIEQYNGEYLDTIRCNDMDFLITRIVDSSKGLDGKIDVREVAQDYYADGTYLTYANSAKSDLCKKIEAFLNNGKVKSKLQVGRVLSLLRIANFPVFSSRLLKIYSDDDKYPEVITSVKPTVFKELKDSKRLIGSMSMHYMSGEIQRLEQEIQRLNNLVEKLRNDENTTHLKR